MVKVLIADDEAAYRQYLVMGIPWEELGCSVCCVAENGAQALELAKEHSPKIIVADISMPILNGLEFIEKGRKVLPDVKIIIISGHDEFRYAQKAIKLSVNSYLLKPIKEAELIEQIKLLKDEIFSFEKLIKTKKTLEHKTTLQAEVLKESYVKDLTLGNVNYELIYSECAKYNIPTEGSFFLLAVQIQELMSASWSKENMDLSRFAVRNVIKELFEAYETVSFYTGQSSVYTLVCSRNELIQDDLYRLCKELVSELKQKIKLQIAVGLSDGKSSLRNAHDLLVQAEYSLKYNMFFKSDTISLFSENDQDENTALQISSVDRNMLLVYLRSKDMDKMHTCILDLLNKNVVERNCYDNIYGISFVVISTLIEFAGVYNKNIKTLNYAQQNHQKILSQKNNINEICEYLVGLSEKCILEIEEQSNVCVYVKNAQEFIDLNFMNSDLRQEDIAREIYVNKSYLSSIFKSTLGVSVVEYLTNLRMLKAKEYLDNSECNIYEVAERVGYLDPNYFSRCFKKKYGITPKEYIRTIVT